MQYIKSSTKTIQELIKAIEKNAINYKFGVLSVRSIDETLASKGFNIGQKCSVIDICNPSFAHTLLTKDLLLSSILPCRISLFSNKDKTTVVMNSLVQQIDDINPDFTDLAQEAQGSLISIIDDSI